LLWILANAVAEFLDDPWSGGAIPRSVPLAYIAVEFGCLVLLLTGGGLLATLAGIYILFGRHGVIFDREARTLTMWRHWPFGNFRRVPHLEGFRTIHVRPNGRRFHAVCFTGPPEPELMIALAIRSRTQAEQVADRIALFLDWVQGAS